MFVKGGNEVQIITWNDQHEHHAIRPSTGKQWNAYDLSAYYIQWYKTGVRPAVKREVCYKHNKIHPHPRVRDLHLTYSVDSGIMHKHQLHCVRGY